MNHTSILDQLNNIIKQYIALNDDKDALVVDYKDPGELKKLIQFDIDEKGVSENEFLDLLNQYLNYSVNTGNKQFLNQLYSGFNFPAFVGEVVTAVSNTSMYTYEVAPVATTIEKEMVQLMNSYCGYSNGDGIFVSGGSNANLVAMFTARNQIAPATRFSGYDASLKLTAFINEQAHYSFETAANIIGIGAKSVIKVKATDNGSMCSAALEKAILESTERGETPFFVGATCGTTMLGAYDPLDSLASICKKYGIWLHADGSFGGSLILSKQHRGLMNGIELTDSFAWNPHKLMNIPLICSALLVKKKGVLQQNITDINTDYIFHDIDNIEDLGKKSIQCGRRVDAVKLWFAWKYFGIAGYEARIDNIIAMASYAASIIESNEYLELIAERQSFSVCFRYKAPAGKNANEFNLAIREQLRKTGKSMVNYGYLGDTLAIRLITANGDLSKEDIDLFFHNLLACCI